MGKNGKGHNGNGNGKRGRPKLALDFELIERLGKIHCTQQEIADALGVSKDTLKRSPEFRVIYQRALSEGRKSLRRLQWEKAEGREGEFAIDENGKLLLDDKKRPMFKVLPVAPDTTMQIWLGKQILGQTDKQEVAGETTVVHEMRVIGQDQVEGVVNALIECGKIKIFAN